MLISTGLLSNHWDFSWSLGFPFFLCSILYSASLISELCFLCMHGLLPTSGGHFMSTAPSENGLVFNAHFTRCIIIAAHTISPSGAPKVQAQVPDSIIGRHLEPLVGEMEEHGFSRLPLHSEASVVVQDQTHVLSVQHTAWGAQMGTVRSSSWFTLLRAALKETVCYIPDATVCFILIIKPQKSLSALDWRMFVALIRNKASLILTVKTYFTLGYLISLGAC